MDVDLNKTIQETRAKIVDARDILNQNIRDSGIDARNVLLERKEVMPLPMPPLLPQQAPRKPRSEEGGGLHEGRFGQRIIIMNNHRPGGGLVQILWNHKDDLGHTHSGPYKSGPLGGRSPLPMPPLPPQQAPRKPRSEEGGGLHEGRFGQRIIIMNNHRPGGGLMQILWNHKDDLGHTHSGPYKSGPLGGRSPLPMPPLPPQQAPRKPRSEEGGGLHEGRFGQRIIIMNNHRPGGGLVQILWNHKDDLGHTHSGPYKSGPLGGRSASYQSVSSRLNPAAKPFVPRGYVDSDNMQDLEDEEIIPHT